MTTKHRFSNKYALQIRERDHNPPHAHVTGGDIDAAIDLETLEITGLLPATLKREVLAWIADHHTELMEEWRKWHA